MITRSVTAFLNAGALSSSGPTGVDESRRGGREYLAGPLRELAPLISVLPVSGGLLGLSGILASRAESVCEAYADLFALDPVVEKEEWCRITGRKN